MKKIYPILAGSLIPVFVMCIYFGIMWRQEQKITTQALSNAKFWKDQSDRKDTTVINLQCQIDTLLSHYKDCSVYFAQAVQRCNDWEALCKKVLHDYRLLNDQMLKHIDFLNKYLSK